MKMIRACRNGKIKMILSKSLSRFAQGATRRPVAKPVLLFHLRKNPGTVECLQYVRELKDLGIAVVFEKEGINTADINCETMITMPSIMAQAESESLSKNLKWSF